MGITFDDLMELFEDRHALGSIVKALADRADYIVMGYAHPRFDAGFARQNHRLIERFARNLVLVARPDMSDKYWYREAELGLANGWLDTRFDPKSAMLELADARQHHFDLTCWHPRTLLAEETLVCGLERAMANGVERSVITAASIGGTDDDLLTLLSDEDRRVLTEEVPDTVYSRAFGVAMADLPESRIAIDSDSLRDRIHEALLGIVPPDRLVVFSTPEMHKPMPYRVVQMNGRTEWGEVTCQNSEEARFLGIAIHRDVPEVRYEQAKQRVAALLSRLGHDLPAWRDDILNYALNVN